MKVYELINEFGADAKGGTALPTIGGAECCKQYIRDDNNNPIGLVIACRSGTFTHFGWSLCSKDDRWSKEKAHRIALGRLIKLPEVESEEVRPEVQPVLMKIAQDLFYKAQ